MPSEREVEAGAQAMAELLTIEAPKLPAACWMGSARVILEAAERIREDERRKNCKHPRKWGSGSLNSDGSSRSTWRCPDCGLGGEISTPPRSDGDGMRTMLSNWPR